MMTSFIEPFETNWPRILDLNKDNAVVFRVDSSTVIGTGHVMRCLTLAEELRGRCKEIVFICRELPGNMMEQIATGGFRVFSLQSGAEIDQWQADAEGTCNILLQRQLKPDWLVVDNYRLDKQWEFILRPLVKRIMVIDDLADRGHDCDLLLDQNYYQMESRYQQLVPKNCRQLLGPKYALLRREFKAAQQALRERDGSVKRLLVFYGGSDSTNETAKALEAINMLNRPDIVVDVVVGVANPKKKRIKEICSKMVNTRFYCQVENIAELMAEADLSLGAGGTATWERCYLGLPALVTIVAENQRETVEALAEDGVVWNLGWYGEVATGKMVEVVKVLLDSPEHLTEMTKRGFALMKGFISS